MKKSPTGRSKLSGGGPGAGGGEADGKEKADSVGVPTDTLASTAKFKSLQGRNRELRFICEREKRILDWEWHSVKVQFEKERMLFRKRALRMLEAPRKRHYGFHAGDTGSEMGETDEGDEQGDVIDGGRSVKKPEVTRPQVRRPPGGGVRVTRRNTTEHHHPKSATVTSNTRGGNPTHGDPGDGEGQDDQVMLEELQELDAKVRQEKRACRSAPAVRTGALADPLYQLSSRLPKLEAEFSHLIKEHNALRRRKVEIKIKDFLVRIDSYKKEQKRLLDVGVLHQKAAPVPMVTFQEEDNNNTDSKTDSNAAAAVNGAVNGAARTVTAATQRRLGHKVAPHSAVVTSKSGTNNRNSPVRQPDRRSASRASNGDQANNDRALATPVSAGDDPGGKGQPEVSPHEKRHLTTTAVVPSSASPVVTFSVVPRVDVERTPMLDMWEEFTKDMTTEAMKRLVAYASKNKFGTGNLRSRASAADKMAAAAAAAASSSGVVPIQHGSVFKKFMDSLGSGEEHPALP